MVLASVVIMAQFQEIVHKMVQMGIGIQFLALVMVFLFFLMTCLEEN